MTPVPDARAVSRRSVLAAGLAGAGAVSLAACGSSSPSSSSKTDAGSGDPAGQKVAALSDIKVGQAISAKADGKDVIVSRPTAQTAACFSAICTHQGCTVRPEGAKAVCPCHGSVFDALTGKVLQDPATVPLPEVKVTVKNGEIVTA